MPDRHWTANTNNFLYRVTSDYVRQLETMMEAAGTKQSDLANALGVTEGRVSQVLNNPGNLTLKKVVEYARALGKKVAIVAYDDADPNNQNGPVNSEIFSLCWDRAGQPSDFFEFRDSPSAMAVSGEWQHQAIDDQWTGQTWTTCRHGETSDWQELHINESYRKQEQELEWQSQVKLHSVTRK